MQKDKTNITKILDMKRLLLLLVTVFIMSNLSWASPVDSMEAKNLAQTFWSLRFPEQPRPVFEDLSQSVGVEHFYIFNNTNGSGFVMVSGDDCAVPILGYSGSNNFIGGELRDNIQSWMGYYDGTIGAAVLNGEVANEEIADQWNNLRAGNLPSAPKSTTAVNPLLSTTWDQDAPYNNLCPGTGTNKAYVGCVATAMAQLMKYYNWPTTGTGSNSYYCNDGTYNYGTLSANFGATTYNWANMLNSYPNANSGTTAQRDAVATLMYHCGVAINMVYTPNGSGAWTIGTSYPYYPSAESALKEHFNYSPSLYGTMMSYYSNAQWISMLKNDLDNNHPVIYAGDDQNGENGHCFVCDGYDYANNFHFNWGWDGWCDGYFVITSLTPNPGGAGGGNYNYSYYQQAIFGAVPNNGSNPPATNTDLHVYSDYTYSPNPLQQNQTVTVEVNAANAGSSTFTGTIKLALLTANNTEAQVIGELSGSINSMTYAQLQYSGTVTVPAGTYQMALLAQNYGENTWSLLGNGFGYANPITVTVAGGSTPPVTNTDLHVYSDYTYSPNPLQQNQSVSVQVSVANAGLGDFTGTIKLALLTANNTEAQVIDQVSGTLNTMTYASLQYNGTVTVPAGTYQMAVLSQASGESTWTLVGNNFNYPNPITVTVTGGSTPPDPSGCNYLHYPLPGTLTVYDAEDGGYVSGSNVYGDEAKADYFTYSGSGSIEKIKITVGAMDGTQGSVVFKVWADNNGVPGTVLGSKTVTLSEINNNMNANNEYECIFSSPIAIGGNFFAGLDVTNATSYFGLATTTDGTAANTGWEYYDNDWWTYEETWELSLTNAIFPYVCSGTGPTPPDPNTSLNVYSDFTYTPNPLQQNQSVSVEVSVANTGSSAYTGTLKLVLLNSNNVEAQVIGQSNISLNPSSYFNFQFSGTVTVPAGTYQMAVYAQANGTSTWNLVGNNFGYANPVSVTVTGGSNPPADDYHLVMYEAFSYMPNPLQQNQSVTVNASVGNSGNGTFEGSLKLVLLNANNFEAQTIGQQSLSSPLTSMVYTPLTFSGTITVSAGNYQLALYYQATGESTWTLVGNDFGVENPVSVTVTGGSTPPVNDFHLVMYEAFSYMPNPMQQNQSVTVNASVGNSGNGSFNGIFKLVLLNSNNFEAQTIGQQSLSSPLTSMLYTPLSFSGTITVPAGTYQLALYYQATGESTWTLVGNDFGVENPVSVTVTGGSNPPANDVDLNMFTDFMYMPDPMKQNAEVIVSASVINMGNTAFTGSLRLALETFNDEFVQTIQQIPVSTPVAPNGHTAFNFSGTVTATPGFYNLILYYKPDGASNWTVVGSNYNASFQNPKSVIVTNPDGIDDHTLDAVRLRPNPATDHFYIDVPDQIIDRIEIVSSTGQIVHTQKNLTGSESIDISFLRSGVYFVRYETSGRVGIRKLIVQ